MEIGTTPDFWYAFLQLGVMITFVVTALRAWKHSRARFVELITAFLFGLLLEQGDIFLFGTYRYNENWILLGDVPIAIALTWALIIAGAMNITDALGVSDASINPTKDEGPRTNRNVAFVIRHSSFVVVAPMADAVWAILLDLAIDAIAIRLGLWTWTIRADQGWFGVPWGNFFAWLFVAFWFSFFTRWVRARHETERKRDGTERKRDGTERKRDGTERKRDGTERKRDGTERKRDGTERKRDGTERNGVRSLQWVVPILAFLALIATLVPFVALENTAALPFVPDDASVYRNEVWVVFVLTLALFVGVTWWAFAQARVPREPADHWLLLIRLVIHGLFLGALLATGMFWNLPLLLVVAVALFIVELRLTRVWLWEWSRSARRCVQQNFAGARLK